MIIKLIVDAGEMKPGPAIAQKLGPLGINMGKVISEVNSATSQFKGMKVPAILDINSKTREFKVSVATPPTSELLKKEFAAEKGSSEPARIKIANAAIEQVIKIAKIKEKDMLVKSLKAAVRSVLGSCVSLGILVESEEAKNISKRVNKGEYDNLIEKGIEKVPEEKLNKLKADFDAVKAKQEKMLKEEEAAKAVKEAEKAAAKVAAGAPAEAAAAATTAAAPTAAAAPAAKAAETKEKK